MNVLSRYTAAFREGSRWLEANLDDFRPVAASTFDHPVPSGVSLATLALARAAVLNDTAVEALEYLRPLQSDFYNVAVMIGQGLFHQVHSKDRHRLGAAAGQCHPDARRAGKRLLPGGMQADGVLKLRFPDMCAWCRVYGLRCTVKIRIKAPGNSQDS